jgi:hypothetical protein
LTAVVLRVVHLGRVAVVTAMLAGALTAASAALRVGSPASAAAGGAFMLADFALIRLLVSRVIRPGGSRALAFVALIVKVMLFVGLLAVVALQLPVEPLSFAAGASMLPAAFVLEAIWLGDPVGPLEPPARAGGGANTNLD